MIRKVDAGFVSFLALCICLQVLQSNAVIDLAYQRISIEQGVWWRLVSGQLVHNNLYHFLINMAGMAALYGIARSNNLGPEYLLSIVVLAPVVGLAIFGFEPRLVYYVGLSAALHGAAIVLGVLLCRDGNVTQGGLLLAVLAGKLIFEWFGLGDSSGLASRIGIEVAERTHLLGAASTVVVLPIVVRVRRCLSLTRDFRR